MRLTPIQCLGHASTAQQSAAGELARNAAARRYATRRAAPIRVRIASRPSIICGISSRVTLSAGMKRSASGCGEFSSTPSASACATIDGADRMLQIERQQQPPAADFAETVPRRNPLQLAFQKQPGIERRFQELRLADLRQHAQAPPRTSADCR